MTDIFAPYVAILGRGPGRSRDLSQEEARTAFGMILQGEAAPEQLGAFMMLLRYRGENPGTIAGLVAAARQHAGLPAAGLVAELDWPSYGAGRTRGAPWFLLAALALAASGVRVCMHGSNEFGSGMSVVEALARLGLAPAQDIAQAAAQLRGDNFSYLPLGVLSPRLEELLALRRLFGLRSPVNTLVRLLDPAGAAVGVDGVFHPPYIETHLGAAELLGRPKLLVIKGGGGEVERTPKKPVNAYVWQHGVGRTEYLFPAMAAQVEAEEPDIAAVWRGEAQAPLSVPATIALGLLALGRAGSVEEADTMALALWDARRATKI